MTCRSPTFSSQWEHPQCLLNIEYGMFKKSKRRQGPPHSTPPHYIYPLPSGARSNHIPDFLKLSFLDSRSGNLDESYRPEWDVDSSCVFGFEVMTGESSECVHRVISWLKNAPTEETNTCGVSHAKLQMRTTSLEPPSKTVNWRTSLQMRRQLLSEKDLTDQWKNTQVCVEVYTRACWPFNETG